MEHLMQLQLERETASRKCMGSLRAKTEQAKARFRLYSQALCGTDGLPHLIVDGRWSHAGDFIIPGIAFLYIAGCIGWAGRGYLIAARAGKDATMKEIQIDLPLALKSTIAAASSAFRGPLRLTSIARSTPSTYCITRKCVSCAKSAS